ncbi:DapH/DapD/GlmU-related protein [Sedimentibacter sp.]|uniref:DapH/DapD/GlmU-related protein n=1 Tax=Sedimentibacter sp. TaxID=1960295 RepID=UPI00289AF1B6|nr:DapH/DapD/GlmU-related protein [Sedimentibacter sp.]
MMWNGLPIVIFGSGGTSKDALHIIEEINKINQEKILNFIGFVEQSKKRIGEVVTKGYEVITCDGEFDKFSNKFKVLGIILPMGIPKIKMRIYENIRFLDNIVFPNIIHPNVTFDKETISFGIGNVIASGAILTHDIIIGNFNLINNNASIGHDCIIGNNNVINPSATISGNVIIKDNCLIGTGANILQQISLGDNVTIGAGSVVTKDVEDNIIVVGVPAKRLMK